MFYNTHADKFMAEWQEILERELQKEFPEYKALLDRLDVFDKENKVYRKERKDIRKLLPSDDSTVLREIDRLTEEIWELEDVLIPLVKYGVVNMRRECISERYRKRYEEYLKTI